MKRIVAVRVSASEATLITSIRSLWPDRSSILNRCLIQLYINDLRRLRNDKRSQFIPYRAGNLFHANAGIRQYKQAA